MQEIINRSNANNNSGNKDKINIMNDNGCDNTNISIDVSINIGLNTTFTGIITNINTNNASTINEINGTIGQIDFDRIIVDNNANIFDIGANINANNTNKIDFWCYYWQ